EAGDRQQFHRFLVECRDAARAAGDRRAAAAGLTRALSQSGLATTRPATASHMRRLASGEHLLKLSRSLDRVEAAALMRQLRADPDVVSVRPDQIGRAHV